MSNNRLYFPFNTYILRLDFPTMSKAYFNCKSTSCMYGMLGSSYDQTMSVNNFWGSKNSAEPWVVCLCTSKENGKEFVLLLSFLGFVGFVCL